MTIETMIAEKKSSTVLALSATELAYKLGISLRHVRRMDSSGKLPRPIKLGASVRWPVVEIEQWLAAGAPDRRTWQSLKQEQR
jgi:prophage regulatory protein